MRKYASCRQPFMSSWLHIQDQQKSMCDKLKIDWTPVDINSLVAFNESLLTSISPINGLRHPKQGAIDGWYLWSGGEIPQTEDYFFKSIHVGHLIDQRTIVLKFLGLPPGWRFQIDDTGYEDVWFDISVLNT
jgi:hypothetical protein